MRMMKIPSKSWNGRNSRISWVAELFRISIPLLMLLCVLPAHSPVSGEALPDFERIHRELLETPRARRHHDYCAS